MEYKGYLIKASLHSPKIPIQRFAKMSLFFVNDETIFSFLLLTRPYMETTIVVGDNDDTTKPCVCL